MKKDVSLLVVRLIIGAIFIMAGWFKISAIATTVGYFHVMGIPAASFLAPLVGYCEFIGGILLILGLWLEYTSIVLGIIVLVATCLSISGGFQAFGLPLATLAGAVSIFGNGAGKYHILCKRKVTTATTVQA